MCQRSFSPEISYGYNIKVLEAVSINNINLNTLKDSFIIIIKCFMKQTLFYLNFNVLFINWLKVSEIKIYVILIYFQFEHKRCTREIGGFNVKERTTAS